MQTFTAEHTPAHIVKVFPKASDLFKTYQIDFCCGGDQPLRNTFTRDDLNGTAVLSELNTAYEAWKKEAYSIVDWDSIPLTELVDYIIKHHHGYLKEELPKLGEFVTKVYRKHGADQPHLQELHRLYNTFKLEMEEHTFKEENNVFPFIKEYDKNPSEALLERIRKANNELEDEHESTGNKLKRMRDITGGFEPHAQACGSYQITYDRLRELEEQTFQHIHLENNVLFKRL